MKENDRELSVDILKHIEDLSNKVNGVMGKNTKSVFERYPLTFALLVLFGIVAVSEGAKGVLESLNLDGHPWYMLVIGLLILIITGQLYRKLDK